ncbi:MAG: hypothetical protein ACOCVS_02105 [Planctomycetota bacterium]
MSVTEPLAQATVAIRAAIGPGIGVGHYMRCLVLARALQDRGHAPVFLIDDLQAVERLPRPFACVEVEHGDPEADQARVASLLADTRVGVLVVDDYRLGAAWEAALSREDRLVVAIDDLCRKHAAALVVDPRWQGPQTATAYDRRVAAGAVVLAGPAYSLVDPRLRGSADQAGAGCRVLLTLGGGGDARLLADLSEALLRSAGGQDGLEILAVVGPVATGRQRIMDLAAAEPRVSVVEAPAGLGPLYRRCHLAICAAGGTINELTMAGIPAISFPLAANQANDPVHLSQLGHLFHVPDFSIDDLPQVASLLHLLRARRPALVEAMRRAPMAPDGRGGERVAAAVETLLAGKVPAPVAPVLPPDTRGRDLGNGYRIRAVDDGDCNHYLSCRNLPVNRRRMLHREPIRTIDHYRWWCTTDRRSWLLSQGGGPSLYIWHRVVRVDGGQWLVGGWFVCSERTGYQEALLALQWQLATCRAEHPGLRWIAVIHRDNRYVQKLNTYLGFDTLDDPADPAHRAIRGFFADPDPQEYVYVCTRH